MKIKKIISVVISLALSVSILSACGKKDDEKDNNPPSVLSKGESFAINSVDFVKNLKLGWNLGNTLDATGTGLDAETGWGQPKATQELFDYVKECGFTSVRIPVSWSGHADKDYKIDEEWFDRVEEVVNYALNSGLYVVLNSHHDNDFYYPTEAKYENSSKFIKTLWEQIAERFKNYDESLVFEGMNEPRLTGTNLEWWFNATDPKGVESIKTISKLNQDFVDAVRETGGKNKDRFLMVPSNAANADNALNEAFTMPKDSAKDKIILSVHAYSPYDFAMNENGPTEWDGSLANQLDFMDRLNTNFVEKGYGVVIGEFGATNKNNLEARVAWAKDFTKKASGYGMSCMLWDNAGTKVGQENFGMINRISYSLYYKDILDAMLDNYK